MLHEPQAAFWDSRNLQLLETEVTTILLSRISSVGTMKVCAVVLNAFFNRKQPSETKVYEGFREGHCESLQGSLSQALNPIKPK